MNRLIRIFGGSIRKRLILAGMTGILAIAGISAYAVSGSSSGNTQAVAASPSGPAAGAGAETTSPALPTADASASASATAAPVAATTTAPPAAATKAAAQAASKPKTTTKPTANPTHSTPAGNDCLTTISASVVSENWNGRVLDLTVHLSIPQLPHACPVTISLTAYSASGDALATETATTSTTGPGDVSGDLDFSNVSCIKQFSSGRVTVGTESGYPLTAPFPPSSGC